MKHSVSIGVMQVVNEVVVELKPSGKLTHEEYQIIVPVIEGAISEVPGAHINVLVDGTDLDGWEVRAAWDDFKLGLKHGKSFRRVAIITHKRWQEMAAKVGNWFISGEIKTFESRQEALDWVAS